MGNQTKKKKKKKKPKVMLQLLTQNVTEHFCVPRKKQIEIGNNFNRNRIGIMRASIEYAQDDHCDDDDDDMMPTSYA